MRYMRYLSYVLEDVVPTYGNTKSRLGIKAKKDIKRGDSCNTYEIMLENHWGTHIDAPAHFFNNGKKISGYRADYWLFRYPCVIDLPLKKARAIGLGDIHGRINKKCEIVLVKTDFHRLRGGRDYSLSGPAIDPLLAIWLRRNTDIRAIGLDFVSAGSYKDRPSGRKVHRAFLDPRGKGRPILIIEDMDLSADLDKLECLYAVPLLVKNVDSAPCTVLGIFKE